MEDIPISILKVLIPTIHLSPVPLHWYHHSSPVLTRELRVGEASLQSSILRSKGPLTVQAIHPIWTLWGWCNGCPSPDPREGDACYCWSHKQLLQEPGQREAKHKYQEGHTTIQSHRDHHQASQNPQSLGQGPPELGRWNTHTFCRSC